MSTSKKTKADRRRATAASLLGCAALAGALALPGCSRKPSPQMRHFAETSLAALASAYTNLQSRRAEVTSCKKNPCENAASNIVQNPAYALLVGPKEALDLYDVREREYRSAVKNNSKQSKADAAAQTQLNAVRDAFANCAFSTNHELRDRLVAYRVWTGAKPADVTEKTRAALGLKSDAKPRRDACAKYQTLHDQAVKQLAPPPR